MSKNIPKMLKCDTKMLRSKSDKNMQKSHKTLWKNVKKLIIFEGHKSVKCPASG